MKRVVITGIGAYSCLGVNIEEIKASLHAGKSGVGIDEERTEWGYRSPLTGILPTPNLKGLLHRRYRNNLGQEGKYAFMSTTEALKMANMDEDFLAKNDVGILFGNDSVALSTIEAIDKMREKKDSTLLGSSAILRSMNSTVTMNLSTIFGLRGINFTLSGACASGSHAIGIGYTLIRHGMQKQIICGGAQEVNPYAMGSFDGLSAFSIRTDEPTKASRPFDKDRDGLVPSGRAATVIIEDYDFAVARGATILGEIIGYGFSSNGGHITRPSVDGAAKSLQMSIDDAKINPNEIDYVSAHATSTPVGDQAEAQAIFNILGGKVPVSSTKSMTGHECWMAGASEIVYSMIMMQNDFIAPNINFENPDEHSEKINIITETTKQKINTFLSNSFGFGGTNSSLIIRK
ncbi:MAG: beta-ketoacyl-[acyl-carrier-protein] synthase family protein [Chitinophagales bacterium]